MSVPEGGKELKVRSKRLTAIQQAFCWEYVKEFNVAKSCKKTGTSMSQGFKYVSDDPNFQHVRDEIDRIREICKKKAIIEHWQVLDGLAKIWHLNAADFYDASGNPLRLEDIPEEARKCIQEIYTTTTVDEDGNISTKVDGIKWYSKLDAAKMMVDMMGWNKSLKDSMSNVPVVSFTINPVSRREEVIDGPVTTLLVPPVPTSPGTVPVEEVEEEI